MKLKRKQTFHYHTEIINPIIKYNNTILSNFSLVFIESNGFLLSLVIIFKSSHIKMPIL